MAGIVESEVLVKTLPTLVQGGVKLFEFGKTRRELTEAREEVKSVRKELDEKNKKIVGMGDELTANTIQIVAVTDELVEMRKKLVNVETEFDDYQKTMKVVMWSGGAAIFALLLVVIFLSVKSS